MRLTASQLRDAVTNPAWRPPPPSAPRGTGGLSTDGQLRTAIRAFHDHGNDADAARQSLRNSFSSDYWRGAGAGRRATATSCLETYLRLVESDPRPAFAGNKHDFRDGDDVISIEVYVIVMDDAGYLPRLCVPGPLPAPLTDDQRLLFAAPAILAVAEDLEVDLFAQEVVGAQVWELRSGHTGTVGRADAEQARPGLRALLDRLAT